MKLSGSVSERRRGGAEFTMSEHQGGSEAQTACDSLTVHGIRFVEVANLSHLNVVHGRCPTQSMTPQVYKWAQRLGVHRLKELRNRDFV